MPDDKKIGKDSQSHSYVSPKARAAGALITGAFESVILWPFDKYKNVRMAALDTSGTTIEQLLRATIGPDYHIVGPVQALRQSYRGLPAHGVHKVINRGLKLGCQPHVMEAMMQMDGWRVVNDLIGKDNAKLAASAISGGLLGFTEVVINPVDRMKILCQKNTMTIQTALSQMRREGMGAQYAGWKETACRNVAGSSTLFFGKFLTYRVLGLKDHNNPTFLQSFSSSMVGASMMLTVSQVPDVLKVRAQIDLANPMSMRSRFFQIVKTEGPSAFFQGFLSKLIGAGLKFGVVMTACDLMVREINNHYAEQKQLQTSNALCAGRRGGGGDY